MFYVRGKLHEIHGRSVDRMNYKDQERLAKELHFRTSKGRRSAEKFMEAFFDRAEFVSELAEEVYHRKFANRARGKQVLRGRSAIELLEKISKNIDQKTFDFDLLHALRKKSERKLATKDQRDIQSYLWNAFELPERLPMLLRFLDRAGVLSKFFPAWRRIRHRIQHNFLHSFTIDEHLLRCVQEAATFILKDEAGFKGDYDVRVILASAWLHDIAKGGTKDHSKEGVQVAQVILQKLGAEAKDISKITFLVRHHLLMSHTAQRRDLDDPTVIFDFCQRVPSLDILKSLYVLTLADMRATGPAVYSSWKASLLKQLFTSAVKRIESGPPKKDATKTRIGRAHSRAQ